LTSSFSIQITEITNVADPPDGFSTIHPGMNLRLNLRPIMHISGGKGGFGTGSPKDDTMIAQELAQTGCY